MTGVSKLYWRHNAYAGTKETRFSLVRYGNIVGSRGSVIPIFLRQRDSGTLTITDSRMTRFLITLEEGVGLVHICLQQMQGGEIYIPKIPSVTLRELAKAVAPRCRHRRIGIRPGEKMHEVLITEDEARHTHELPGYYVIEPSMVTWPRKKRRKGRPTPENFRYASDTNPLRMTPRQIVKLVEKVDIEN